MHKFLLLIITTTVIFSCNQKSQKQIAEEKQKADSLALAQQKTKIYFTFDDGPNAGTKNLYRVLQEENIPAGLFLVAKHYQDFPLGRKLLDSIKNNPLFEYANHSYSHAFNNNFKKYYSKAEYVVGDYEKSHTIFPMQMSIARLPGRNLWRLKEITVTDEDKGPAYGPDSLHKLLGYKIMGWDVSWPYDYKTFKNLRTPEEMMNRLRIYSDSNFTKIPKHLVLLAHDQQFSTDSTAAELKQFIQLVKQSNKYEFAKLSDYPGL